MRQYILKFQHLNILTILKGAADNTGAELFCKGTAWKLRP